MKDQNFSQKVLKFIHKFGKFNLREKVFLWYLIILCLLLFFPIIKITSLRWSVDEITKFSIRSSEFVWTLFIVLISLIVLILWNVSNKFKNLFYTYFGGRENDSLINFLFLFIIITVFLSIKNTVNIASNATSTISYTWIWTFLLIWLLLWIIITLISVFKWAQKTWKHTKIINVVDEEHTQLESTKDEIKKWLFDNEEIK